MHPRDFTVNRTWVAFRMNRLPVLVVEGEESDIFVLQDAASMFIFGTAFAPHGAQFPAKDEVVGLLQRAWSRRMKWPAEIFLPAGHSPGTRSALPRANKG